ncbi:caspase family protein [Mesorhizobium sp. M1143]|uniref:caspase family protein n=1 Tax=Mesorhizobium sp. M1143 TaxID=2957061 RepID=UPI0033360C63
MRQSAGSFAESIRALVIGVGSVAEKTLAPLPECVQGANRVFETLTAQSACRLPPAHVCRLTSLEETTRNEIRVQLKNVGAAAGLDDTIVVYFAGHGVEANNEFFLSTSQTKYDDLRETSISADDIIEALGPTRARGLLLICDCCGGAAIAERSPQLFTLLGDHFEYRIVLSASKRGQSSWEVRGKGSPFTNLLIEALLGRFSGLGHNGEIYFNDLFDYLSSEMETTFSNELKALPRQEPVFAGSFAKDPLIFVNSDATLNAIRLNTSRYSAAYVRRRVRTTLVTLGAAAAILVIGLWTWLDQHHYLSIEGNGQVSIYRGYPDWKLLGYPQLLWETGIRSTDISPASKIAMNHELVFQKDSDAVALIADQLTSTGRARWLESGGQWEEARRVAETALSEEKLTNDEILDTQEVIVKTATVNDTAELIRLAKVGSDIRTAVLKRLLQTDRPAADKQLADSEQIHFDWAEVQTALPTGCSADLQRYVDWKLKAEWAFAPRDADFLLRTGCVAPAVSRDKIDWSEFELGQALVRKYQNPMADAALASSFGDLLATYFSQVPAYKPLQGAAADLPGLYQQLDSALKAFLAFHPREMSCDPRVQEIVERGEGSERGVLEPSLVQSYLFYLLAFCPNAKTAIAYGDDKLRFTPQGGIAFDIEPARLEPELIKLLSQTDPHTAEMMAQAEIQRPWRPTVLIMLLGAIGKSDEDRLIIERLLKTNEPAVQFAALVKLSDHWNGQFVSISGDHLSSLQDEAILDVVAFLNAKPELRDELIQPIAHDNRRPALQGELRVLTGTPSDVVKELTNPERGKRIVASNLLSFRGDLDDILQTAQSSPNAFAAFVVDDVRKAIGEHARLIHDISSVGVDDRVWRANIEQDLSKGGKLLLRKLLGVDAALVE